MKRKRKNHQNQREVKRAKLAHQTNDRPNWPLLRYYYPDVSTLRQYLASRLLKTSKKRCRRLLRYGTERTSDGDGEIDDTLVRLLDETVIGAFNSTEVSDQADIDKDITVFTQQLADLSEESISPTLGAFKQSEIVDFAIWFLFRRHQGPYKPPHLLCQGYQAYAAGVDSVAVPGVPGVFSNGLNSNACTLQQHPWSALPPLLGKTAERVLGEMLLDCGVFQPFPESSNLTQISGTPLCELKPSKAADNLGQHAPDALQEDKPGANGQRGLSDIRFIRHRMLYARPMLNAKRDVSFGLGHTHVLNRCRDAESVEQDQHILRHIFPRQFNLHNVFTSEVDRTDTGQPFKDYTFREQEIAKAKQRRKRAHPAANDGASATAPLPKRLRTHALELVRRLRNHQARCSYSALLQYYCPPARLTNLQKPSIFEQASSVAQVSAFCRTVVTKVIPAALWGQQNTQIVMRHIDRFLRLRRYESLSVHDILQGIQVESVEWLAAEKLGHQSKMSQTDFKKRQELMAELLYYLFDSFLFPLIRGHFHVTESGAHRNQLFYFRHDVWKAMSEPALASLKESMLEPCDMPETRRKLSTRALGVSRIRFLPKEQGMRPIINLRRRVQKLQHGRLVLGRSINSILTPTFSILNYEKSANEAGLASALFSVEDMYPRLQAFRRSLHDQGYADKALYFAKVDVKACFDTIPQKRLLQLARQIINTDEYSIAKYARAKLTGDQSTKVPGFGAKPSWKFLTKARPGDKTFDLSDEQRQDAADGRSRTVYVNTGHQRREQRRAIIDLLDEHVEANLIKLGNRFYRQKEGIPQGSIVSSLLCSYFYSEMEAQVLGFLDHSRTMLLRLIDDFLVISTDRGVAERFMHTMHRGIQEFGVEVKSEKSLANFDVEVDGRLVGRLPERTDFPYCGNAINTVTLDLSKDKERRKLSNLSDSTSVEHSKLPGQTFYGKMLNALKLQLQPMLLSTTYNSVPTVLSNLHHAFSELAQKSYHYMRSLSSAGKQPAEKLLIRLVDDMVKLACVLMCQRKRSRKDVGGYGCCVTPAQTRW